MSVNRIMAVDDKSLRTIHVVGAAILHNAQCLVTQRHPTMSSPLEWEFPGGKVKAGESLQQALQREIQEELGVLIRVGQHLGQSRSRKGNLHILLDVFQASLHSGEIRLAEHLRWGWFNAENLAELTWSVADIPLVPRVQAQLISS